MGHSHSECTNGRYSYDCARPDFSSLAFLGEYDEVYPEIGYGDKANAYFRYKDGRDQGYLCSVSPNTYYGYGFEAKDSLRGPAFSYLGGVLYDLGCHCSQLPEEQTPLDHPAVSDVKDGLPAEVVDRVDDYDAVEIHGVREVLCSDGDTCCEVDDQDPESFSVYLHMKVGGVECIRDFHHQAPARSYAQQLGEKFEWPVYDYSPK